MANEVTNLEQAIKDWKSGMAPEDAAKKNQISRMLLERTIIDALNPMNTNDEVVGDTVSFQKIKQDLQKMPVLEVVLENSDPSKKTTLICYQTADGVKSVLPYYANGQLIDLDAVYREYGIKKILVDSDGKVTIDSDKEINYNQIGFKDKNKNVSFWNKFSDYAKDIKAAFLRNEQQTPQAEANNLVKDFQAKIAAGDKKGAQNVQSKIAEFLKKHPDLANILQVALQPIPDFSTKTQTVKQVEDTYTPQNINGILDIIGINTNTNDGKKILERMSLLPQEILNKIKQNVGDIKEAFFSNELEPTFDNVSNVLEFLEGVTLRNEDEYTSSESQRQEIITQIKAANFMATLYETVANDNDQYTDNLGLFGLGTEGIGYVMNKLHLDGENHYQWADSCREWAKNSSELKVLNPQKFKEGFKKIYGDNAKNWGIDYNSYAFKKCFALAESGKAYDKDNKMTDEYKEAIHKAMNFVADDPNDSTFNQVMNGFGEALIMIATLGWGAETKAGTTLATATMGTFSNLGVSIASKQVKHKLLQGALRFSGQAVKLVGPALNEGTKMYLYTAAEGTVMNVSNRAIKQDGFDKLLDTQAQVMTNANGSFTFGAFAGVFGSTVTQRVMQAVSKTSSKVTTALADKFSQGPVDANKVFATIMEKSVPTRIAEVAAFATDVVGFTAFESALTIANTLQREGSLTPEKLANTLMEEFKNQGYSLGQIKVISHLIMTLVGSRSARMQSQKYLQENLPQLKGVTVEGVNGGKDGFKINLPNGKKVECKNASEMIASIQLMSRGETALSRLFNNNSKSVSKKVVHKAQKSAENKSENGLEQTVDNYVNANSNSQLLENSPVSDELISPTNYEQSYVSSRKGRIAIGQSTEGKRESTIYLSVLEKLTNNLHSDINVEDVVIPKDFYDNVIYNTYTGLRDYTFVLKDGTAIGFNQIVGGYKPNVYYREVVMFDRTGNKYVMILADKESVDKYDKIIYTLYKNNCLAVESSPEAVGSAIGRLKEYDDLRAQSQKPLTYSILLGTLVDESQFESSLMTTKKGRMAKFNALKNQFIEAFKSNTITEEQYESLIRRLNRLAPDLANMD